MVLEPRVCRNTPLSTETREGEKADLCKNSPASAAWNSLSSSSLGTAPHVVAAQQCRPRHRESGAGEEARPEIERSAQLTSDHDGKPDNRLHKILKEQAPQLDEGVIPS